MPEHICIHEADFGRIDANLENINSTLGEQKTAMSAFLKYMYEREALNGAAKEKKEWSWKKAVFYSTLIISISGIIVSIILKVA
ncbi:MAG TPA: hypothetical protein VMW32_00735 [Bacteroidales bacterium]|nr:hypothetical protein [Bacteroidales bacterium]